MDFKLHSEYQPGGDQPQAIDSLTKGIAAGSPHQVLLGVTGSGKTYSLANVIEKVQLPTLIISHNKTLAAQLYQEFRDFFPENAVSYFVSYYDYYQPEAYIPQTDTYIEKETDINAEIDKLRLSTTTNLLTRPDCIVVASVSCIYNLGSPLEYSKNVLEIVQGQLIDRESILKRLVSMQYERNQLDLRRGTFRLVGESLELFPSYQDNVLRIVFNLNEIKSLTWLDPLSFEPVDPDHETKNIVIYPAKHYITDPLSQTEAFKAIRSDMAAQVEYFKSHNKLIEAQRLEQKVNYDLETLQEFGFVNGIENYSRYFDGRSPGDPPFTLLDYMAHNAKEFGKSNFLTVVDESHITLPQIRGMYFGDRSRKETLIDYGFRLPAALDNRPINFEEFMRRVPQAVYTSATPQDYELSLAQTSSRVPGYNGVAEQLIRPTGLLDPEISVRPISGQVTDVISEVIKRKERGERVLITTLTKRMAEDLAAHLKSKEANNQADIKVHYLHSDIETLDRSDILDDLRSGEVDVVVGINLLREGLDLPEVSLVAILDADKEGFLRSHTSLIQTMGRAARHSGGEVILYADKITDSMKKAMEEVNRRRQIQLEYNQKHNITPQTIIKPIRGKLLNRETPKTYPIPELVDFGWDTPDQVDPQSLTPSDKKKLKKALTKKMNLAAKNWEFEKAATLRDAIARLG